MIRVLYGEDEFSVSERLRVLVDAAGPPEVRGPSTSVFENERYSRDELIGAASAVPFLAEKRLVIVRGLLGRIEANSGRSRGPKPRLPKGDWTGLPDSLVLLPPTTELIFVDGKLRKTGAGIRAAGDTARVEEFAPISGQKLDEWIRRRFDDCGARANPSAVRRLAELVGGNLRLLDQEIRKLALFAAGRQVQRADIDMMVAPAREANIFAAVDAVLERKPAISMRLLHQLLDDGRSVQNILAMLARQVRLVLVAQDMSTSGSSSEEIARRLGLKSGSYPLRKTMEQARRFSFSYLAQTHRRLLEADVAFKTGADELTGIELLVARLSTAA